jgi:cysteine-rich repeat protein
MLRTPVLVAIVVPVLACGSEVTPAGAGSSSSSAGASSSSADDSSSAADDDASTTSLADTSSSSSGGEPSDDSSSTGMSPAVCGNGQLEPGEDCDDGNARGGDGCSADCTVPFEIAWTAAHDGSASDSDLVRDLVVDGDGSVYVVGGEGVTGQGSNVWLQQYLADGSEGWTYRYDGADSGDDIGIALARTAEGDFVVAGIVERTATDKDILLLRIDGRTRELQWELAVDGPGSGPGANDDYDYANAIAIDPLAGNLVVVGTVRVDGHGWDAFAGAYDGTGAELWTRSYDGPFLGDDTGRAVLVAADGSVRLFANQQLDARNIDGVMLVFDADGTPLDDENEPLDFMVSDAAYDGEGNFVLTGESRSPDSSFDITTRSYDPAFAELWSATFDGDNDIDFASAVVVAADGSVYAVGQTLTQDALYDAIVLAYDDDGDALWRDVEGNELGLDDIYTAVATDPNGDVIAAGYETVLGQDRNALVRKYHPL